MPIAWVIFTKRTDAPKLNFLECKLTEGKIPHKRDGESWHAPILMVPAEYIPAAEMMLAKNARKSYGLRVRHGISLDDVPDDHRDFEGYQAHDWIPDCDGNPPCEECSECLEQESPDDYRGMGWVDQYGRP